MVMYLGYCLRFWAILPTVVKQTVLSVFRSLDSVKSHAAMFDPRQQDLQGFKKKKPSILGRVYILDYGLVCLSTINGIPMLMNHG